MVDEVPCCPLVMPLSLDVRASEPPAAPHEAAMAPPPPTPPAPPPPRWSALLHLLHLLLLSSSSSSSSSSPPVVLHQPFSSVAGAKGSSLPPEPGADPAAGGCPASRTGRGGLGRGAAARLRGQHHQDAGREAEDLLYQEYAPCTVGSAAETPGSGRTPDPERWTVLSTLSDSAVLWYLPSSRRHVPHLRLLLRNQSRFQQQMIPVAPEVVPRQDVKLRSWSTAASPPHPQRGGARRRHPDRPFSVVSTEDDLTQRTCKQPLLCPARLLPGHAPSPGKRPAIPHSPSPPPPPPAPPRPAPERHGARPLPSSDSAPIAAPLSWTYPRRPSTSPLRAPGERPS
ncbi:unnamed protein product [Arctogadus glacialis]